MISIDKLLEIVATTGVVEDIAKFDFKKSFKDNGIDSLDVFTVFLAVEEQLGVKFSEEESTTITSLEQMKELLSSR